MEEGSLRNLLETVEGSKKQLEGLQESWVRNMKKL